MLAEQGARTPLAIVGIGCHLPGDARSAEDYWTLLCNETDATRTVPETRWNAAKYYDPNPAKVGKMATRRGGFLSEIDQFDPQFFGISPREANLLDPQQRLLLQTTWEALEDAGIPPVELAGADVGVFVGGFTLDYQLLQNQGRTSRYRFKVHSATGMMMTMLANRISYAFDFRGPSMTIDTACSSSLVAVHLAAMSIWNGECDLALAGGVNIMIGPNTAIAESKSGFLSPDGRCKAFDESADGYARGEGGAVVVIKPLVQALRNGDEIYAQILGTAVSQDGHTDSITVPSADAQQVAISTALRRAGLHPNDVGYVEAHGTGTPVGDPVEVTALAKALAADRPASNPLLIGSVKTNIGHLEAGAGVAGLIKAALVLKHAYIPANLHLTTPSTQIPFAELGIDIPRTGRPFPDTNRRIAGVNSFGFGGTNAHVVLAEHPTPVSDPAPSRPGRLPPALVPISARSEEALAATARRLAEHLSAHPDIAVSDLGYTLSRRRSHLNHRRVLVADSIDDARDQLRVLAERGQSTTGRAHSIAPKLAFVCTGMGPQWWKMCRGLLDDHHAYGAFAESIARSDRELSRYTDWSLLDELRADETHSRMADTEVAQPANFAVQIALAAQLEQFGITPDAVVGHSAGEVAAHYLAGVLSFEQAIEVIYHRSRLQQRTTGLGRMLAIGLGVEALDQIIGNRTADGSVRRVSIAAINSPSSVTVVGDGDAIDEFARHLDEVAVFHRLLHGKVPYHSHFMDAVREELLSAFDELSPSAGTLPLYSTVTGEILDGQVAGAAYWWQNTRASVLFEPAVRRMLDDGFTQFVELGPHPVLSASITEIAATQEPAAGLAADAVVVATQRRNDDDARALLNCVGALYRHGHDIAWEAFYPRVNARVLKLPSYPWQTKRYWNETPEAAEDLHYNPVHPLLGQPVNAVHPTWEAELSTAMVPFLADHRVQGSVVVPGAVYIEMALAAGEAAYGSTDLSVVNLTFQRALILDDTCDPMLRTTLNEDTGALEFAAFTATAGGNLKWTITATAELATLPRPRDGGHDPAAAQLTTIDGDEFYARARTAGFSYEGAFQALRSVTSGPGWATAEVAIPEQITGELDSYRFHPALIDGAFQALLGTPLFGNHTKSGDATNAGPYLPTRIRRSAIYGSPEKNMTVRVQVVAASKDEIDSDITITGDDGQVVAVFTGFTVQSLNATSRMSPERMDKGLYEIEWVTHDPLPPVVAPDNESWLVFVDTGGAGDTLAAQLRRRGQRVHLVTHRPVDALTELDGGYALDPRQPHQLRQLLRTHLDNHGGLAGIVDCWPLDINPDDDAETRHRIGAFPILHLVGAFAEFDTVRPRLYLITANAQPAPGTREVAADQAAIWGLGRVFGHQELVNHWGGLIDLDGDVGVEDDVDGARVVEHILARDPEDQIALRDGAVFVPRLRQSSSLTRTFPTKLAPDATYVVTGGAGALGRTVAKYLAERGARHLVLLGRSAIPPRRSWPELSCEDRHYATVAMIRQIERLGARVATASVDITDFDQLTAWLERHTRENGRPVRGVVHAAGSVNDQLLVNMTEADFADVVAPKITGTRLLHNIFRDHDLDFFVMFGSAGSVISAPGQGNYAAANAYLDAFAHYRRSLGLPALTIGWGPWSVGMVEELKLEKIYEQRGIELITPAAGTAILDRLLNQRTPHVVAINADWMRARRVGLGAGLPPIFSDLGSAEPSPGSTDPDDSILDFLARYPEADRLAVVAERVRQIVAGVFELAVSDIGTDDAFDDIGMDSMMAMEFRLRIKAMFGIDLPVLELLRGVSVNSLAPRILGELQLAGASEGTEEPSLTDAADDVADDDVERLIEQLSRVSGAELRALLAELDTPPQQTGQAQP